jgi:hypothetical protein
MTAVSDTSCPEEWIVDEAFHLKMPCKKTKKAIHKPLIGFMYGSYEFRHKKTGHLVSAFKEIIL